MAGDVPGTAPDSTAPDHPDRQDAPPAPLALYRRYRPATFAEVKGQEHVTEPLRQALRNGRVHHAYLFSGPRGCGKTSSARILARSLNCEQGPTPDPCGVCASCVALAPTGPGSIDVIEIDAASHGGVDDARDLRERAFYAPVSGRFKIYIIDEAHMVTREGFNALLKLVEEPPPHLKFVFATTEPEKVIPTIRSRTHHYPFRLVPPAVLRELLEEILASEGVRYEPAVLPLVVRAGAGSVRDSLSVLDQLLAGAGEEGLTYERTVALLGYTDDSLLDEMVDAFAAQDGAAAFAAINKVVEGGHDSRRFAADLLDRCRDLIILAAVPTAGQSGLLDVPADRLERMAEQARQLGQAELTRAAGIISDGLIQMRGTTSPRLLLELMCAQVLLPGAGSGEQALLARVERLEQRLAGAPAGIPQMRNEAAAGPATLATPAAADGLSRGAARRSAPAPAGAAEPGSARRPGPARAEGAEPGPGAGPGRRPGRTAGDAGEDPQAAAAAQPAAPPPPRGEAAEQRGGAAEQRGGAAEQRGGAAEQRGGSAEPAPRDPAPARPPAGADPAGRPAPPPAGTVDADVVRQQWPAILDAVRGERRVAWMLLSNATVHSLEDGVLVIGFAREGEAKGFAASGYDQDLIRVLGDVLGVKLRVRTIAGVPPGSQPAARPAAASGPGPAGGRPAQAGGQANGAAGHHQDRRGPEPDGASRSGPGSGGPGHGGPGHGGPSRQGSGPPPRQSAAPEDDWPDEPMDPEDGMPAPEALSGMDLITRQLGGQIIAEIDGE